MTFRWPSILRFPSTVCVYAPINEEPRWNVSASQPPSLSLMVYSCAVRDIEAYTEPQRATKLPKGFVLLSECDEVSSEVKNNYNHTLTAALHIIY